MQTMPKPTKKTVHATKAVYVKKKSILQRQTIPNLPIQIIHAKHLSTKDKPCQSLPTKAIHVKIQHSTHSMTNPITKTVHTRNAQPKAVHVKIQKKGISHKKGSSEQDPSTKDKTKHRSCVKPNKSRIDSKPRD